MAKIISTPVRPDVTLVLTADEADLLFMLLRMEAFPVDGDQINTLNAIYGVMADEDGINFLDNYKTVKPATT